MCWFDPCVYCNKITAVALANTSSTSHNHYFILRWEQLRSFFFSSAFLFLFEGRCELREDRMGCTWVLIHQGPHELTHLVALWYSRVTLDYFFPNPSALLIFRVFSLVSMCLLGVGLSGLPWWLAPLFFSLRALTAGLQGQMMLWVARPLSFPWLKAELL